MNYERSDMKAADNPEKTPGNQGFDWMQCLERDDGRAVVLINALVPISGGNTAGPGLSPTPLVMEAVVCLLESQPDPRGRVLVIKSSGERVVVESSMLRNLPEPVLIMQGSNHPEMTIAQADEPAPGIQGGDDEGEDFSVELN